jgi:hypothetical protein
MAAAEEHGHKAEDHRRAASAPDSDPTGPLGYQCGDVALSDQTTSGGERLVQSVPCWNVGEEAAGHQRALARREQQHARAERAAAASLVATELSACRGVRPRDLDRSPFAHSRDIAAVIPHRETGRLRGVRIVWKPVLSLTAGWMRQVIDCHRARFERLGEPATYLPDDPTLLAGASVTVEQHGAHLEVVVVTDDDVAARVAVERAQDLLGNRTAVLEQ